MACGCTTPGHVVADDPPGTGLGFRCTKNHGADSGMDNSPHTHGARLNSDIEGGTGEPVIPCPGPGIPGGIDFRMSTCIMGGDRPVIAFTDYCAGEPQQHQPALHRNTGLPMPGKVRIASTVRVYLAFITSFTARSRISIKCQYDYYSAKR